MAINFLPDVTESNALDLATIFRATQAIFAELELEKILKTFLNIAISGANKCILLLQLEQQLQVAALVESGQQSQIFPPIAIESSQNMMISSINLDLVDRVRASLEPLIINSDRSNQEPSQEPQTILYLPLLRQDQLIGILYLEHNLEFTSDRLESLNFLCSQAAIAIKNSQLHTKLTEKYQTLEQEFSKVKRNYLALTEVVAVGIFRFDAKGQCVYVNNRWCEMTGRPASVAMGLGWVVTIHPDDIDQLLADWTKAYESDGYFQGEARYLRPDGSIVWFYTQVIPEFDGNGNIISYIGSLTDISDRKLTEATILKSEAHKTALFRALPDLIMRVDQDGTYLEFQATKNFKVIGNTGDFIGTKIQESLPPELAQKRIEMIGIALRTGSIQFYEQDISVGGKMQAEEVRVVPYTDNEVLLLVRDISDRKRAEIALQQSEERYRILSEFSPVGVFRNDAKGICTYANAKTLELTGLTLEENLGDGWGKNLHPDDRDWMYAAWTNFVEQVGLGNDAKYYIEHRYLYPDGSIKWGFVQAVPERNTKGDVVGFIGSVSDISDRKQSELALQSLLEGTAAVTGKEFFPELVKHIAIALDVSQVYLTQLKGEENFETLAWYSDHQIQPNLGFKVANTPCELTIQKGIYTSTRLKQQFPQEEDLEGLNSSNNYLGVAMQNTAGEKLGVISVINDQPLPNPERAEVILRIFAQRAIAELERLQTLEYLQNLNDELEQRVQERTNELEESRNILQLVLDTIPQRVFWKDRESRFLGCNPAFAGDASCSVEFIIGKTDLEMPWAEWADLYRADDAMVMESRIPKLGYEEPLTNFNGDHIWLRTSKIPLTNKQGDLIGIIGCYEDISDRKQAEKELSQARNFLEAIIENIPLSLFVKNGKAEKFGEFLLWNKTCEAMFGLTKEQAVGKSGYNFFPKEQADFFRDKDNSSFALAKIEDIPEEPIDSLILGRRILHTIKVPIFDEYGNPNYLICISEDISDRKQAEIALKKSEEDFRAAFEQASVGMAQADLNGQFIKINQRFCNILGYTEAELLKKSFEEITHPDDLDTDMENVREILAGKKKSFSMEKRYIHKDGHIVWANLDVSIVNSPNGKSVSFFGVVQDISDRKQMEKDIATLYEEVWEANSNLEKANKQLEAYSNNLESLVYHRTNELKSAQIQIIAQEKLASLGTLTAGVAHELRNPLNFVKNYAEGSIELGQDLLDTLEPLMPSIDKNTSKLIKILIADLQENSNAIQRHSDRAEKVINNMMQYTRNDNEKIVTQSSDLNDLIDQSLKLASFSKRIIDTNFYLAIHTNYAANLAMVNIFPSSLGRAIINVVENACDAMRFKQTKLQSENPIPEYEPTLNISTRSIEELVEIRIKDNGCGIPPDIQPKILDPFFTTKPPGEGTGLGLSLTHDIIVNQHQGTLKIGSQLGEYTEVIITLPYKNLEKADET